MCLSTGIHIQHCSLVMIEKVRKIRDEKGVFAAVLTNLLKALEYIPHQLFLARPSGYGFDVKSIVFISACHKKKRRENKN